MAIDGIGQWVGYCHGRILGKCRVSFIRIVMQDWKLQSVLRYVLLHEFPLVGRVDAEHDQPVVTMSFVDFLEMTYLLVTGRSSDSPLKKPNVLSPKVRKLDGLSIQRRH